MLASSNQEMNEIIGKIFSNEVVDKKLSQYETLDFLNYIEKKHYDYGYKSKKVIDIYYRVREICDEVTFDNYFYAILDNLSIIEKNIYIFTKNLLISDFILYNKDFFSKCVNNKFVKSEWFHYSSFKVVKYLLQHEKVFNKIIKNENFHEADFYYKNFMLNTDDRVFKLGIGYITEDNILECLLLLNISNHKFFLKRIKMINNHINLKKYFNILISLPYKNFETLKKIIKIYQNNSNLIDIGSLKILNCILNYEDMSKSKDNYFALKELCIPVLFKTIQRYLLINYTYIPFIHNIEVLIDIVQSVNNLDLKIILDIINKPYWWDNVNMELKFELAKQLNKYRKEIIKLSNNKTIAFMIFYENMYPIYYKNTNQIHYLETFDRLLKINRIKSFLRVCMKRIVKTNFMSFENKKLRLFKQIKNFTPQNIPVLSRGSYNYQIINQSYHNMKPPTMFKISKKYLSPYLTLKVDGVQVNRLPSLIKNDLPYIIRAEYLELDNKDLYMVYDINIPDMTYIERVSFLRRQHPYHLPEYYEVNNIKDLLKVFKQESILEQRWIKENKDEMSIWYPKAFIKYNGDLKELAMRVLDNGFNPPYLNYPIDGLIVSSCGVDSKIKPKVLHTIDIKYSNGKWYDNKNNEICYSIINPYEIDLSNDSIYRCYPETDDTYVVKEERYDKIIANSIKIINDIRNSYFQLSKNSYYQKNIKPNKSILKEIKNSRINELVFLRGLDLSKEFGILDLCSGKGNILNILQNHYYYTLIDKNPITVDESNNVMVRREDLSKLDLKRYKDDYWICINGLWYIYDNFMSNVIKYKPKVLVFNTHSVNPEWSNGDSYLKLDGSMIKYKYEWCHNEERVEPYLEGAKVLVELDNLGYTLIKYHKNDDDSLSSNFEFYYFILG